MRHCSTLLLLVLLAGCKPEIYTTGDAQIRIEATPDTKQHAEKEPALHIRIFDQRQPEDNQRQQLRAKMNFLSETNFYMIIGGKKIPFEGIIPIANGVKDCFEYMVILPGQEKTAHPDVIIYQDQYITGKSYQLSLK
jgi:hypothetical protein